MATDTRRIPVLEAHGARIPALGFGTWELRGRGARRMVERALEMGVRHIDTAQGYGNETEVGEALAASGVARDEVFLTTKVWPDAYQELPDAAEGSLERLGVDRVDLLLLHWPSFRGTTLERTVEALNTVRDRGWTRHIGVSNFTVDLLERAWAASDAPLATDQVEYHPFLDQDAVLRETRRRGMVLTAYSPLAKGRVVGDEALASIGRRHGKTAAQVSLRWLLQQEGVATIPRTSDPRHLEENLDVLDFDLSSEEMERISSLARPAGRVVDPPSLAPAWD